MREKMILGCLDMGSVLAFLVFLILAACPVYTANTCGAAPNGDTICLYRTAATSTPHSAAKMACESMQEQLAEILDQPTQDFIENNLLDPGMDDGALYWIGLRLDMSEYKWEHSGTVMSYDNFAPSASEVSECVCLVGTDGVWQDIICGSALGGYFCQKEANPTTAKTTRFVNTSPRGTTSVAPSTAPPTSLAVKATARASVPPTIAHDGTTSQVPPTGTTSQTDLIQSTPTDESQPNFTSTTGETSTQTINSTTSSVLDFKELSTEACNGHCKLTLEERLTNATLDDVSDIVENEDLGSEDILQIQGWFEDNVYIREEEENYLRYTRTYLHTFNEILNSTKEDTFELANPVIFAESCNELLEDFAGKWSFNETLKISYSNIETELVREFADTFEGFTSDFNAAQNEEQLDGFISIQNDWVEDYNTTDNSTIDIIVVMYQASMVDSMGNDETNEIVSNFVSITVVVDGDTVSLPVTFGLELDEEKLKADKKGRQVNLEPLCVFWEYSLGNDSAGYWSTYGCAVISQNATYVQCSCNHTTNFAILMQTTEVEIRPEDETALSLLSLIGLGISTAALLITIIVLVCLPSLKSDRVFIHKHLVVALIIAQTLFISTLGAVHQELICKLVAISLHYFYLAVFMWMLIEGVHLYLEIVQVFSRFDGKNKTVHYIVTGWGLPLIVVGVSVAIRWKNYGTGKGCWLSIEDGLIWSFLGPVAFVIVINFIILLLVIRVVFRASSARGKDDSEYKHIVAALKGALFLLPLLGLTWTVGFMSVSEGTLVFQYLFVILNSLQGLFIFLFYCAMNKEVRTALSRRFSQVALESGGSKSLSLRAVAKLKSSGKSTSPVFRLTDSSGASVIPSKSSGLHSEDEGKRESISASGISVHQKEPHSQLIHTKTEPSQSPFSPDYD